jgi:hypothetical protein
LLLARLSPQPTIPGTLQAGLGCHFGVIDLPICCCYGNILTCGFWVCFWVGGDRVRGSARPAKAHFFVLQPIPLGCAQNRVRGVLDRGPQTRME